MPSAAFVTVGLLLSLAALPRPREATGAAVVTPEHEALLRRADVGLAAPTSFRAVLILRTQGRREGGRIEVWRSTERHTLVRFLDPAQRGKYLLYTESDLWFLAPGSRKPVKLPLSFRIQGAVTLDDILGRRYSRDYRIQSVIEGTGKEHGVVEFHLEPRVATSSFASVLYVVARDNARPERVELRLRSGRLATILEFGEWSPYFRLVPLRLTLRDALRNSTTAVEVALLEEREIPPGLFDQNDPTERVRLEAESGP